MTLGNDRKKQRNYKTRCLCIAIVFYIESIWAWDAARDVNARMVGFFYTYTLTQTLGRQCRSFSF